MRINQVGLPFVYFIHAFRMSRLVLEKITLKANNITSQRLEGYLSNEKLD
jgi:hypothetical protein